ncbi:Ribokinase-like protein [Hysterangium stoloniferum]|nr:Ribokinase-like protein [Hysterangium stoloniferum]
MENKGSNDERILSIQSHVASGYVGGRAAIFPLQLLGYEVDVVNTVNYSNHAGYGRTGGWKATPEELSSLFDVMNKNGLLNPSRLLTGYVPGAEALRTISQVSRRLRNQNPSLIYLLDPVMGDSGKLYVSPDVIPVYRELLSSATIITPNYFEAELLTGTPMDSVVSLRKILHTLHTEFNVPHVVISSIPLGGSFLSGLPAWLRKVPRSDEEEATPLLEPLLCVASSALGPKSEITSRVHALCIPRIPGYFSGVGDLFAALVLGHFIPNSEYTPPGQTPLSHAAARSCKTTHAILWRTHQYAASLPAEERTTSDDDLDAKNPDRKVKRMKGRELRLVKEQKLIVGDGFSAATGGLEDMREWVEFWQPGHEGR